MRRFWLASLAALAGLLLAMAMTLPLGLGFGLVEFNVAFAALGVATALGWRRLRARRVATITMAYSGIAATATGFAMLYTKDMPAKEWMTWWHSVTSVALLLAFLVHWTNNNPRLAEFTARLFTREARWGTLATIGWVALLAFGLWTWLSPDARAAFTRENYLYLSSWAILMGVCLAYGPWLLYRIPSLRARLAVPDHRNRSRALVDTSLFLSHWGALLTGFALLYFAEFLHGGDLKYVSKWWHTATSVLFLAFVAIHVGFNARLLAAHARRIDGSL